MGEKGFGQIQFTEKNFSEIIIDMGGKGFNCIFWLWVASLAL